MSIRIQIHNLSITKGLFLVLPVLYTSNGFFFTLDQDPHLSMWIRIHEALLYADLDQKCWKATASEFFVLSGSSLILNHQLKLQ